MGTGYSIHIGLNRLSSNYLGLGFDKLHSCEFDSQTMIAFAQAHGFDGKIQGMANIRLEDDVSREKNVLLADSKNVTDVFKTAARTLIPGDTLFVTYSGHGSSRENLSEDDEFDESWCLWDREFLDDEILLLLTHFAPGVRVILFSDSCHSGTIVDLPSVGLTPTESLLGDSSTFDLVAFQSQVLKAKGLPIVSFDEQKALDNQKFLEMIEVRQRFEKGLKASPELLKPSLDLEISSDHSFAPFEQLDSIVQLNQKEELESDSKQGFDYSRVPLLKNVKTMPREVSALVHAKHSQSYRDIRIETKGELDAQMKANPNAKKYSDLPQCQVVILSACADNEETYSGCTENEHSLFTCSVIRILGSPGSTNQKTYLDIHSELQAALSKFYLPACDGSGRVLKEQSPQKTSNSEALLNEIFLSK